MRAQKLTIAAVALAAGLSLTACQGGGDADASGKGSDSSSSSSSSSGKSSGGGNASGKNASNTSGGDDSATSESGSADGSGGGQINTGQCQTANLEFSSTHGMGEGDLVVRMKNTGEACSLKGFPGVDLRSEAASGPLSAKRSDVTPVSVVLQNGDTTRFTLHYPPNNSGGSGVDVTAIEVTPPNETHSKTLSVSLNLPVTADTGNEVTVDPVGTGKQ
ncbi:DUF4232 domain-containing protein [Streptomyces sp. NPDC059785]|uniref:DUF4232 domain-containing protein n=1 Tax=unclassified Streptomyces TaxID=2593676 RepID=UPI00366279CE